MPRLYGPKVTASAGISGDAYPGDGTGAGGRIGLGKTFGEGFTGSVGEKEGVDIARGLVIRVVARTSLFCLF